MVTVAHAHASRAWSAVGSFLRLACAPSLQYLVVVQSYTDTQQRNTHLLSYFHVNIDNNTNPLVFFLSKKTMFSSFPFSEVFRSNARGCHTEI